MIIKVISVVDNGVMQNYLHLLQYIHPKVRKEIYILVTIKWSLHKSLLSTNSWQLLPTNFTSIISSKVLVTNAYHKM